MNIKLELDEKHIAKFIADDMMVKEKEIAEAVIAEMKRHSFMGEHQNVTVIYNAESNDILYTVSEVAKIIKTNSNYVYELMIYCVVP